MHRRLIATTLAAFIANGWIGPVTAQDAAFATDAPEWCKSKWGPGDEIGSANLLSPQRALAAAKLITTGKTYSLGTETNSKTPAFGHRTWSLIVMPPGQAGGLTAGPNKVSSNEDAYMGYVGIGSQLDGLGHAGIDNVFYNCYKSADFVQVSGLTKLGIEKVPNIVARGVVLDMAGYFGKDVLDAGTVFNRKEIDEQAAKQGIEIREGDVVLFHTGWLSLVGKDDKQFLAGEPGLGKEGASYLADKNVLAVGADTWALEVVPFEPGVGPFEVHQTLIAKNGIYILEAMRTDQLVADKAWEFMFVLGHSRFTGGVQAIINPTAIR